MSDRSRWFYSTSWRRLFSKSARRRWFSGLASLLLLTCGVVGFAYLAQLRAKPPSRAEQQRTYQVDVYRVERQNLREMIVAFGTARGDRQVVLTAQVPGEIVEIHPQLRVGLRVPARRSQGQPFDLLVIDQQAFGERVSQAERRIEEDTAELARLDQDKANNQRLLAKAREDLAEYRKEYERVKVLRAKNVATQSQLTKVSLELRRYEDSLIALENARKLIPLDQQRLQRRRDVHRSDLALAKLDLDHTRIRAPFAGVLGEVHVEQGQFVRPGEPLVRLIDDSVVEIPVSLTLADYVRVRDAIARGEEPSVELAVNESDAALWNGQVARVAPEVDELTRTAKAFVVVDNRQQKTPLVPGTFVHARIEGPLLSVALVIPRDAILRDERGREFVFVVKPGPFQSRHGKTDGNWAAREAGLEVERRVITIGRTLQTLALVTGDALRNGDLVVLTNLDVLGEKSRVRTESEANFRTLGLELKSQRVQLLRLTDIVVGGRESPGGVN